MHYLLQYDDFDFIRIFERVYTVFSVNKEIDFLPLISYQTITREHRNLLTVMHYDLGSG